jgi:hypothetical protein
MTACYAEWTEPGQTGAGLVAGWLRRQGTPHIRFLVSRPSSRPPGIRCASNDVGIFYPPGARGTLISDEGVGRVVAELPSWVASVGQPDTLWGADDATRSRSMRGSFDEYVAHVRGGFGWIRLLVRHCHG